MYLSHKTESLVSQHMYRLILIHVIEYMTFLFVQYFISTLSTERRLSCDRATVGHWSDILRVLVDAGSDLNVQNEVRHTVTVASAAGVIPSCLY